MNINEEKDTRPIMVSIRCTAYNHEKYIRDALEGFVMQKTNFRFEAIVHDDASTDGTAAIIREYADKYPDIIKPIYETENQYSKHDGSLARIMNEACKGKYIAFCEGDDYWIDPFKLQKQVDILETDETISMVYTDFNTVDNNGGKIDRERYLRIKEISGCGNMFAQLLQRGNFVMTLTTMFRRHVIQNAIIYNAPVQLDYLLILVASGYGNIYFLNEITGNYRWTPDGQMSTNIKGVERSINIIKNYIEYVCITQNPFSLDKKVSLYIRRHFLRTIYSGHVRFYKKKDIIKLIFAKPILLIDSIYVFFKYGIKKVI